MGGEEILDERPDLVQIKLGGSMRVEHGRVIDQIAIALQDCFNRQRLHVDVRLHERSKEGRDSSDPNRLNAVLANYARNLDATAGG